MTRVRHPQELLAWFDRHRRDLPWRRTRDPYRIWLSEVMLQQTRVEVVLPYYERFLGKLPTAEALAAADLETVLSASLCNIRARNPSTMVTPKKELLLRRPWPTNPTPPSAAGSRSPGYPVETPRACRNSCALPEGFTRENIFELLGKPGVKNANAINLKELPDFD